MTTQATQGDAEIEKQANDMIEASLVRLTEGLPKRELKIMVSEGKECEEALLQEISLLESALKDESTLSEADKVAVDQMLASEFTPPDRFFTVSALLGRLREPMATPLPPNSALLAQEQEQTKKKKSSSRSNTPTALDNERKQQLKLIEKQKALLALDTHPAYRKEHAEPSALLALWKRISGHRTAAVFRRPVNAREAPGYTDRILFPIDLSLIRKMIAARQVVSYAELHQRIGLICHNCVKFNGRESDYALVTREFEAVVDDFIITAVMTSEAKESPVPEKAIPRESAST